jgi:hypothetical protein
MIIHSGSAMEHNMDVFHDIFTVFRGHGEVRRDDIPTDRNDLVMDNVVKHRFTHTMPERDKCLEWNATKS